MIIDKKCILIGFMFGVIIGMIVAGLFMIYSISEIGNSIHVQSINTTISLNETKLAEAIIQSRGN